MSRFLFGIRLAALLCALCSVPALATEPAARQLGVASCAGSTCHGATQAFADRQIRQDEYFVWQREDAHARAHQSLRGEPARRITRALGLGAPEQAPACLACHAPAPAQALRGPRFDHAEGIGCETCHGAAEHWIATHAALKSVDAKLALGMFPTWEPAQQAALCSGCHVGDARRGVTHAMMAAGHPPLLFELDTFVALMPPHWTVDADYRARKPATDPAQRWLQGQLAAADAWLSRLERLDAVHGQFPELALFDCDACHHDMAAGRLRAGRAPNLQPGAAPLADAALVLLQAWAGSTNPALAGRLTTGRERLYLAYGDAVELRRAAGQLRRSLREEIAPRLLRSPSSSQLRQILAAIVTTARGPHAGDFLHAQQTAMAAQVLGAALREDGRLPAGFDAATDALFAELRSRERFDVAGYQQALDRLAQTLR